MFFRHPKIRFLLVHGQVNWKQLLVRSNKCTTRTTRIIDFATPVCKTQLHRLTFAVSTNQRQIKALDIAKVLNSTLWNRKQNIDLWQFFSSFNKKSSVCILQVHGIKTILPHYQHVHTVIIINNKQGNIECVKRIVETYWKYFRSKIDPRLDLYKLELPM